MGNIFDGLDDNAKRAIVKTVNDILTGNYEFGFDKSKINVSKKYALIKEIANKIEFESKEKVASDIVNTFLNYYDDAQDKNNWWNGVINTFIEVANLDSHEIWNKLDELITGE